MDSNMKSVLRSYMSKCGDGRGLEKFLRRNSFSSDESKCSTPITTKTRNKTKSLESLTEPANKVPVTPKASPKQKQQEASTSGEKPKSIDQAKVVVKQSGEKVDKKKSFNYESIIEITLPLAPTQPQPIVDTPRDKSTNEERLEEPIKPVICTPLNPKIPSQSNVNNMSPTSVPESHISNKQNPMEWDSFIPGYESSAQQNFQLCNPMELGDSELIALKTYFERIGLQLPNENLVVVIKNRQESRAERDKQLSEIKRNKDKWQHIYEKYKEKYHNHSNIDFLSQNAQSTPKFPEPVSKMNEKSSQTSLVKNTVESTQVETQTTQQSSKECQVTVDRGTLSSKHSHEVMESYQIQSEIAESFEFIAGSMQQQKRKSDSSFSSSASKSGSSKSDHSEDNSRKGSVSSVRNEDISNFDDSLKVAIALLNSLLESRHMKPELKRNLAGKVIQKIVQIQTSRSIQTSTLGSSGVYPLSQSSRTVSEAAKSVKEASKKELSSKDSSKSSSKTSSKSREAVLKDCLKPMTKSEQNYQHSVDEEPTKGSSNNVPKDQLMDYVKREKQSHLKWIEKEIDHLRNLRDLLKRNETPISIDENCPIYENLSLLMKAKTSKENAKHDEVPEKSVDPIAPAVPSAPGTSVWNSHANSKKPGKHRSKLETPELPSHEESLASFIDSKNRKFLEKYEMHQKAYEDVNIYTRPYSGGKKKLPDTRVVKSKGSIKTQQTATKDVETSTSLASSSVFESSDSISVPVNTNTKTSTTHYQSEMFSSKEKKRRSAKIKLRYAETQTTDSICRTQPIFEARKTTSGANFGTTSTTLTQRIKRVQNDKQLQTNPPSIKYTLTFDKKSRANVRSYLSLPQRGNTDYVSKSSKEIYNQISSAKSDNRHSEDKENYGPDTVSDDDDAIDLQSCLNHNRPDIFTRFEERKQCIAELKKLRALRNEHRKKLLLLTSDKSLEGKLLSSLPELPLRTTRMFSTKDLKRQTQKKINNLTEVQQKKKEETVKNLKRKNRLMTEIFNKNLQRNVLKGNLNLSNTVNLISK